MYAELRQSSRPQRLVGAATTLIMMALLAFATLRPMVQISVEPAPEAITVVVIKPDTAPAILPVIPLQNIDLPPPMTKVNLPEFEKPAASPVLPSLAPITSPDASPSGNEAPVTTPDASPRPSGNEALFGRPDGTGRTNGTGSTLIPPVRRITDDTPFDLNTARRSGLVTSLNFCVTDTGRVSDVQLAATSGFDDTDATAIEWLGRQRFTPGTLDGVRARMCATYDIRWTFSKATSLQAREAAKAHAATIRRRSRYPRQFVYWPQDRPFPGCDAVTICRQTIQ
jgi:hypothetical protein